VYWHDCIRFSNYRTVHTFSDLRLVVFDLIWHWMIVQARGDGVVQTGAHLICDWKILFLDLDVGCALERVLMVGIDDLLEAE